MPDNPTTALVKTVQSPRFSPRLQPTGPEL